MSYRLERTEKLIEREISKILFNDVKDERLRFVTITKVRLSSDMSVATVFYTVFGDENQKDATIKNLTDASGYIRSCLSKSIEMRKVPELRFKYDESMEYGAKIDSILKNIK